AGKRLNRAGGDVRRAARDREQQEPLIRAVEVTQTPEGQSVHRPRQVCKSPTAADRASSSARHDVGATIGRTTNFEKPTPMNRSMTARTAGSPTGVSSTERGRRAVITRAMCGSIGARA